MSTSSDNHKKAMIAALEKSLGVVSKACREVGMARQTHYRWLSEDPEYKAAVEDIAEMSIDTVESELYRQIVEDGNPTSTIFYLKTKGKKRGYVERQEITGADGLPNNIQVEIIRGDKE